MSALSSGQKAVTFEAAHVAEARKDLLIPPIPREFVADTAMVKNPGGVTTETGPEAVSTKHVYTVMPAFLSF